MIISKDLLKKQLKHASIDESKPSLQGILIDGNKTIATDGYRASIITHKSSVKGKWFLSSEVIKTILKVRHKKSKHVDFHQVAIDGNKLTYMDDLREIRTINLLPGESFPDVYQVIPKEEDKQPLDDVCLNVNLLGQMIANDLNFVKISYYGKSKPILGKCEINGLKVVNVVMPIRTDGLND